MEKEQAKNIIQKAKIKDTKLEVVYEELFADENYSNTIEKKCAQIVHADLRQVFDKLKAHLVVVCEMPEADKINFNNIYDDYWAGTLDNYMIKGYSHGGSDESAGVTITGQKLLKSGQILNINTPFIKFEDEESYEFAGVLYTDIQACDYEVEQYLFHDKWGIKQLDFEFDAPEEAFLGEVVEKPKKRKSKKKELVLESVEVEVELEEAF